MSGGRLLGGLLDVELRRAGSIVAVVGTMVALDVFRVR